MLPMPHSDRDYCASLKFLQMFYCALKSAKMAAFLEIFELQNIMTSLAGDRIELQFQIMALVKEQC